VVVLDCAPTAESLRFISMPTTLEWYMKHIFQVQRTVMKAVRPIANKVAPVELPPDSYFANVRQLFDRLSGVEHLLEDPSVTSVRLVTNPERVVRGKRSAPRLLLAPRSDGGHHHRPTACFRPMLPSATSRSGSTPRTR